MIETLDDLAREFEDVRRELTRDIALGFELAAIRTVAKIEVATPIQTGNARQGIGVPGPIAASRTSLAGLSSLRDLKPRVRGDEVTLTLHLAGMEYFPMLDQRYDLSRVPVSEFGDEVAAVMGSK